MIEKKKMWELDRYMGLDETVAIVEDGKVLVSGENDFLSVPFGSKFYDTREDAEKARLEKAAYIKDMIPKVRKFIEYMSLLSPDKGFVKFERKDYLGNYAERSSYLQELNDEQKYSRKLETFIRSRMVNIGGCMIPFDGVRSIEWHAEDDDVEEYEDDGWKAILETAEDKYETENEIEVRLVKTLFGCNAGVYFVDDK